MAVDEALIPFPAREHALPSPEAREERRRALADELGEAITLDGLTRDFGLFQRRRGHRTSTDDLLTADHAITHAPASVERILDLGTGIGSVGLSLAWHFSTAQLTGIEVQALSFRLLRENLWLNGVTDRYRAIHADLREGVPEPGTWPLVTGSPPYFDVKNGIVSADSQRAAARFELHGDVSDYCAAAACALGPGGRFVFCFPSVQRQRAETAVSRAGLALLSSRDVIPRRGLPALFSLFVCQRSSSADPVPLREPAFEVRDADGAHGPDMRAVRARFGLEVGPGEV